MLPDLPTPYIQDEMDDGSMLLRSLITKPEVLAEYLNT